MSGAGGHGADLLQDGIKQGKPSGQIKNIIFLHGLRERVIKVGRSMPGLQSMEYG